MGKVHEYVVSHLPWDGRGRLLDVGCGAGALTIRCARRFPQSHCTSIDYWGIKWDFLDQQLGMGDTWLYETMRCIDRFTFSIFAFLIIERYIIPGMLGDI